MGHPTTLAEKLATLEPLLRPLKECSSTNAKITLLDATDPVQSYLQKEEPLKQLMEGINPLYQLAAKSVIVLGQGPILFGSSLSANYTSESLISILKPLADVEEFYQAMGGLIGYYCTVLRLILEKQTHPQNDESISLHRPAGFNIAQSIPYAFQTTRWGLETLPQLAEIYPVGGAGDRLNLKDVQTAQDLPAAFLAIGGFSLLEGLFRDLHAKEYLYWKIFGKQLTTPVALMTSYEKNNDALIRSFCHQQRYFGRPADHFRWFTQPQVPVLTEEGNFSLSTPLKLKLKPGGHGVLWKLASKDKIFDWFKEHQRDKLLIRQINNPIAGTDTTLLSFSGIGSHFNKHFGFASCERLLGTAEGMLVLIEKKLNDGYRYCITNIEYSDFHKKGLKDQPKEPSSIYSAYPSNANILFADLSAIENLILTAPIPGLLINMKNKVPFMDEKGQMTEVFGGRLESMMQNIADYLVEDHPSQLSVEQEKNLASFIMFGDRKKTISVAKKLFSNGQSIVETTEGCFYDQLQNARDLLVNYCAMQLPSLPSQEDFAQKGPPFIVRYHPALGPLYAVIQQKIQKGALALRSELILEITELEMVNLHLDGCLKIAAFNLLGDVNPQGVIQYSSGNGKCELRNVKVKNHGINEHAENVYWKDEIMRLELLEIKLHGNAEFFAEDVVFEGNLTINVPDGHRMEVTMQKGVMEYYCRKIKHPTWNWNYHFSEDNSINLVKIKKKKSCNQVQ